jgi:hypothetical protein
MNDISEAERLALITNEQVRLVLQEAGLVELAALEAEERAAIKSRCAKLSNDDHEHDATAFSKHLEVPQKTEVVYIDWMTGRRMSAEIIPFPARNAGGKQ